MKLYRAKLFERKITFLMFFNILDLDISFKYASLRRFHFCNYWCIYNKTNQLL